MIMSRSGIVPRFGRGLAAFCLLVAASSVHAETFTLEDGSVVEGRVVRSLGNTVSIKYDGAGMVQIPISSVREIEIETQDGGVITGRLIGWSDGVYRLSTEDGAIDATVEDGKAVVIASPSDDDGDVAAATSAAPSAPASSPTRDPARAIPEGAISAGFVYVGPPDDGGRTFMHEIGRQKLAENPKVAATTTLELESEEHEQVVGAVDRLVADGANLIVMTGNDSVDAVTQSAAKHQDVRFVHCGTLDPTVNVKVFCGRIYEARYLSGIIAGGMTASNLIGYVAAEPTPDILVGINAFALGAQSVNPDASVLVHWTREHYGPGEAQRRATDLIERGVDVMTIHQDSPAALQVAEQRGIHTIGYQSDMRAFAPSSMLTSAVWNWGEMYGQIVARLDQRGVQLRPDWLGLREGVVGLAPISERVPGDLINLVQQRQREIVEGRFNVFTGPIRDVDGDIRIPEGRVMIDSGLHTMNFLVEGVAGY